ncbi:MAG: hypothetical protein J3Q66DRAFT_388279 [Benniella sp.]|nr:MAG: hypothetical protein J3Q66DRAFT_388279 [Benniella sp.]
MIQPPYRASSGATSPTRSRAATCGSPLECTYWGFLQNNHPSALPCSRARPNSNRSQTASSHMASKNHIGIIIQHGISVGQRIQMISETPWIQKCNVQCNPRSTWISYYLKIRRLSIFSTNVEYHRHRQQWIHQSCHQWIHQSWHQSWPIRDKQQAYRCQTLRAHTGQAIDRLIYTRRHGATEELIAEIPNNAPKNQTATKAPDREDSPKTPTSGQAGMKGFTGASTKDHSSTNPKSSLGSARASCT